MSTALPLPPTTTEKVDGRRARRHRSRDLAIDALLDLLSDGVARPTAQQVAERSGVSLRSIFRIFDDVETLHTEAAERQISRNRHLFGEVAPDGPLEQRIAAIVEMFDALYTVAAPVRRAALRVAPESPALRAQLDRVRTWARGALEHTFGPELDRLDDGGATAAAIEVTLSFQAWDHCTTDQGLDPADRRATTARMLHALLT